MWFRLLVVLLFIGMLAPVSTVAQQTIDTLQMRPEARLNSRVGVKLEP